MASYVRDMARDETTEVLYNAACPVCRREISHYERVSQKDTLPIGFADLNDAKVCEDWKITPDLAAQRLHVRQSGQVFGGIPAFIVLWESIPRYRWLARVISLPGIRHLAIFVYDRMLAPALYASHKRRQERSD